MDIEDRLTVESRADDARRLLGASDLDLELLCALLLGAKDAILVLDGGDRIVVWNRAAEQMFGFGAEQVLRRRVFDLLAPSALLDEATEGMRRFTAACAGSETFELAAVRSDGSGIDIELSSYRARRSWSRLGVMRSASSVISPSASA